MAESEGDDAPEQIGEPAVGDDARLPLFYTAPRPLTPDRHGRLGIAPTANQAFAAKANALPLNAQEFALAARDYPIVFAASPPHLPMAICGLSDDRNLFVDAAGNWAADAYVPAYVRRFPFIFLEEPHEGRLVLCVDEGAGVLSEDSERPLYDGDKPSAFTDRIVTFCRTFHEQHHTTRRFAEALAEHGLLRENATELPVADGRKVAIKGFSTVDREAFDALADDVFLDWRRRGWLPAMYLHLTSVANWAALARRAAQRSSDD